MQIFLPCTVLIMISASLCFIAARPFGECAAPAMFSMSLVLYVSQCLLHSFTPGMIGLCAFAVLSIPLFFVKNGGRSGNGKLILSPGFYAFLGCLIVVTVMDLGRNLYNWDELMHWGKMVKEMLRLDQFYCVTESTLYRHKDYPPFIALYEYGWSRLGLGYSEPGLAQSLHLMELTLIVPVLFDRFAARDGLLGEKEDKSGLKSGALNLLKGMMFAVIILLVISFCDPNNTINSIYEDIIIAVMFSYSAFLVYRKEYRSHFGRFAYVLSLVALIGTKQVGIAFVGLSLLYLLLSCTLIDRDKAALKDGAIAGILSAAAALLYYKSWDLIVSRYPDQRQFELGSSISLGRFVQCVTDSSDREHRDMIKRFIPALFSTNIASGIKPITYVTSFMIAVLLLIGLWYLLKDRFPKREAIVLGAVFAVGEAGYALMMLILYELCFEAAEMKSMRSFPRYMGSYFLAELLLILLIAVWLRGRDSLIRQNTGKLCVAMMLACVLLVPGKMDFLVPQGIYGDRWIDMREDGAFISDHVPDQSTVYLAYERSDGDREQVNYSYFVERSRIDHAYYDLSEAKADQLDRAALENTLEEDGYLFTVKVTKGINSALSPYNGGEKLKSRTLYAVEKKDGQLVLTEIAK